MHAHDGFTLIEALVAVGIAAVVTGATLAATMMSLRVASSLAPRAAAMATAQNVLADLRAATAYDAAYLSRLAALSPRSFSPREPDAGGGQQVRRVTVTVRQNPESKGYRASVTVGLGENLLDAVTVQSTLVQEAPAPGSTVMLPTLPDPAIGAGPISAARCLFRVCIDR